MGRKRQWFWLNPTARMMLEEIANKCHNGEISDALFYAIKRYYESCKNQ
jgi:hypothetical protein